MSLWSPDDPELTHLMNTILEHGVLDSVAAGTAQAALATLRRDQPCVLIEVNVPHGDG